MGCFLISFCLGNTIFPARHGLTRHTENLCKLLLRDLFFFSHSFYRFAYIQFHSRTSLSMIESGASFWIYYCILSPSIQYHEQRVFFTVLVKSQERISKEAARFKVLLLYLLNKVHLVQWYFNKWSVRSANMKRQLHSMRSSKWAQSLSDRLQKMSKAALSNTQGDTLNLKERLLKRIYRQSTRHIMI